MRELIEQAGAKLLFLPPYSLDFNPIEKVFAGLKAMLRRAADRTVTGLWDLIGRLVYLFQPDERANYFQLMWLRARMNGTRSKSTCTAICRIASSRWLEGRGRGA